MIELKRTCDKCIRSVKQTEQLWCIEVKAACYNSSNTVEITRFSSPAYKLDVCRPCLESFNIAVMTKPNEEPKPVPTVEEAIRQLIDLSLERYHDRT